MDRARWQACFFFQQVAVISFFWVVAWYSTHQFLVFVLRFSHPTKGGNQPKHPVPKLGEQEVQSPRGANRGVRALVSAFAGGEKLLGAGGILMP